MKVIPKFLVFSNLFNVTNDEKLVIMLNYCKFTKILIVHFKVPRASISKRG